MAAAKNLSLVVLAGAVGYLIYRRSLTTQETNFATISAPVPPGTSGMGSMPRAALSSLGGTNMMAGLPGVWIPEDSSWDKPVVSGLGDLGRGFHRPSFKSVVNVAKNVAITAIPIVGPSLAIKRVAAQSNLPPRIKNVVVTGTTMAIPVVGAAMATQAAVQSRGNSVVYRGSPGNASTNLAPQPTATDPGVSPGSAVTQYQDQYGNPITQDQYNTLMAQQSGGATYDTAAPPAQSASVTNATPVSYSDSGMLSTNPMTNLAPGGGSGEAGSSGGADPTGRFDGQSSGGTDTSTPNVDTAANTPSGGGKIAMLLAAAGAGAFFLFKK